MLWIVPLTIAVAGLITLTVLARRVRRDVPPTLAMIDRFGREHLVASTTALATALCRLHAETASTHRQLPGD